jgi:hypothetical protein
MDQLREAWGQVSGHRQALSERFYTVKNINTSMLLNMNQLREAEGQVSGHRQALSEIFYTVKN